MPRTVHAHQHDTVDALCYRHFGRTQGITEQVLELNPGLATLGPVLPQGTAVRLPDLTPTPQRPPAVQLWD
ncbi:phage tail protein [Halomonas sp. MCCC 1A17488]|uniref:tail protein X n=1 Tax=Halomonadaceae TaxID=28256 RepID=UPI00089EBD8B|nr:MULTISPECIES: tail protein X [Halomonas]MCE8015905.1 phage tail protein [Halomonas sp. MCCC 1A17488]MCG3239238.1 phage tail protein [Halomonas sp. MCCC 1A17488]QPP50827.1 tail protein X [Halomonas sp. SS10-MC5]SEG43878.1 P2-like prophage tail protein X [Halomonas desiderata]